MNSFSPIIVAPITYTAAVSGAGSNSLVKLILVVAAYILPFILIPFMIKSLSGAFGNLAGMVNDKGKGLLDRNSKWRGNKRQEKMHDAKAGNRFKGGRPDGIKSKINSAAWYGTNAKEAGLNPKYMKRRMASYAGTSHFEHAMELADKTPGGRAFFANDDVTIGGLEGRGDRSATRNALASLTDENGAQKYHGAELDNLTEQALSMRRTMGSEAYEIAALAKLPATGTAWQGKDGSKWHERVAEMTKGNPALRGSLVAEAKKGWRASQRYELSEASFGEHMEAISMTSTHSSEEVSDYLADRAYAGGGPAAVIGIRNGKAATVMAEAIKRDVTKAISTGDADTIGAALGNLASIEDQIGSAKNVVKEVISPEVLRMQVRNKDGETKGVMTVVDEDGWRGNAGFRSTHREYSTAEQLEASRNRPPGEVGAGLPTTIDPTIR